MIIEIDGYKDSRVRSFSETIYNNLKKKGVDLLLDDRDLKMGNKLNDFELMGIPYAIIIGSKEAEKSITTIMTRKDSSKTSVSPEDIFKIISGK
jgi:prolyl-tRNA synthetase